MKTPLSKFCKEIIQLSTLAKQLEHQYHSCYAYKEALAEIEGEAIRLLSEDFSEEEANEPLRDSL